MKDTTSWAQWLSPYEIMLWITALISSVWLVIQLVRMLRPHFNDEPEDIETLMNPPKLQLLTLRPILAFFTLFGWVGLTARYGGATRTTSFILAIAAGLLLWLFVYLAYRQTLRLYFTLAEVRSAIDKEGYAKWDIPARRRGFGRILVQIKGRKMNIHAMTDDRAAIRKGDKIQVVNFINTHILLVTATNPAPDPDGGKPKGAFWLLQ
ncbi:MAG TPA: hypothetical protein VHK69_10940 [Chitinophagaceae bacterium]|nr:hypothetical protein [Chitinophagaceae bacterium]